MQAAGLKGRYIVWKKFWKALVGFAVALWKRLSELVLKMLSFKFVIAAGLTAVLVAKPELGSSVGFAVVLVMWIVVFGLREWSKAKNASGLGAKLDPAPKEQ